MKPLRYQGHDFRYETNELRWKLIDEELYHPRDFLKFVDPIITIFSIHGRLFVVLDDGRINEIQGFNGDKTDYERIYVNMRLWL